MKEATARLQPPNAADASREYRGFLGLVSHEFFHLWNVKRIRPDALGPFDYTQENYTKNLWVAEGITDYYADLVLRRAGLISENEFLSATARSIQALQNTPGRLEQSVEESSFDSWIKLYRPDENSVLRRFRTTTKALSSGCCSISRFANAATARSRWTT